MVQCADFNQGILNLGVSSLILQICMYPSTLPLFSQANFDELQPEVVNSQVLKYAKSVYQLEKGLPPNGVVPVLKAKVIMVAKKQ